VPRLAATLLQPWPMLDGYIDVTEPTRPSLTREVGDMACIRGLSEARGAPNIPRKDRRWSKSESGISIVLNP
jgi:hypothetical protein